MEKYYIVKNEQYLKSVERDNEISKKRNAFVKDFFERHEIEGSIYFLRGDGRMNVPLPEDAKSSIALSIEDTEKNRERYGSQFKKSRREGMYDLRKTSTLLKELQEECIRKQVVINIWETRTGDYFKELGFGGYSIRRFIFSDDMYLSINTNNYNNSDITPKNEGFLEINASEFYLAMESLEESKR
ncbi:MAG: hypothetical protein ACRC36_14220 [Lacrimispora sphenoides]